MNKLPNSEILLIYEAKNCNPNGDPDDENRPRLDLKTQTNLVSDGRLKRFFRDYIIRRFGEKYIFVTKISGRNVRADERVGLFGYEEKTDEERESRLSEIRNRKEIKAELERLAGEVPKRCIDARLFGAVIPIGGEEKEKGQGSTEDKRGRGVNFIGPVQFAWGFSLHPVEIVDSPTITSVFSGARGTEEYGNIGKRWSVYYSLIAFYGVVSGNRAPQTKLSDDDLKVLDDVLWKALINETTTESKIGERPLLYMRVEYKDSETLLGDLRRFIDVKSKDPIRWFTDVNLNFDRLIETLYKNKDLISKIYINCSEEMEFLKKDISNKLGGDYIETLPHGLSNEEIQRILARPQVSLGSKN